MEKYFVTYQQAVALKELGFDEPCIAGYRDSDWIGTDGPNSRYFHAQLFSNHQFDDDQKKYCSAPLKSQVFDWFRKQHKLKGFVEPVEYLDDTPETYMWVVYNECHSGTEQLTFEEAELACIDKLIEIVKNK